MKNNKILVGIIVLLLAVVVAESIVIAKYIVKESKPEKAAVVESKNAAATGKATEDAKGNETVTLDVSDLTDEGVTEDMLNANTANPEGLNPLSFTPDVILEAGDLLKSGVGIMGTAGGSLKSAIAAVNLLDLADRLQAKDADKEAVEGLIKDWYDGLDEDYKEEYKESHESILSLAESILAEDESIKGQLEDAGVKEKADELLAKEGLKENFEIVKEAIKTVVK
jgi:hypothetical protein